MIKRYLQKRKREKQLRLQEAEAAEWFEQHMKPTDWADNSYWKEVVPRAHVANFAFNSNKDLNRELDPWNEALERHFS